MFLTAKSPDIPNPADALTARAAEIEVAERHHVRRPLPARDAVH